MTAPITVNARDLANAIERAATITEIRNTIPVLGAVRLVRDGEALIAAGTNLDTEMHVRCAADLNGHHFGALIFEPRKVAAALKLCGDANATLTEEMVGEARKLRVDIGDMSFRLGKDIPVEDWPDRPLHDDALFTATLTAEALAAFRRVAGAVSKEETRYYLNGVYLHPTAEPWGYTAAATDGHRLYVADFPLVDASGNLDPDKREAGVIVPNKALGLLLRMPAGTRMSLRAVLLPNEDGDLAPSKGSRLRFDADGVTLKSAYIDGTFPDYSRVVPSETPIMATLNRRDLLDALAFVTAGASDKGRAVVLDFARGKLDLTCQWFHLGGEGRRVLPASGTVEKESIRIGFNGRYLSELLRCLGGEQVTLAMSDPGSPTVVVDPDDAGFKAVLMPMRV